MKIWVIGGGGIGQALVQQALNNHSVHLVSRKTYGEYTQAQCHQWSSANPELISQLCREHGLPDWVFITTGLLSDSCHHPEKSLAEVNEAWLMRNLQSNLMPSIYCLQGLNPHLTRQSVMRIACFSARVSSISDNRLGGWHAYRMSKAALNMFVRNAALEFKYKAPKTIVFGYHPGTVDTDLSKPFQSRVRKSALFSPAQAAAYCWDVMTNITSEHHGCLVDWQGKKIEF